MRFNDSIDLYIADMWSSGRMNSPRTEVHYRNALKHHAHDVANRDPRNTNRDDVKRTLRRWANANTQRINRAVLVSFYDWTVEEGLRPANPARQTRRPKKRPTTVYRLTLTESASLLPACVTDRERAVIGIGLLAGARNAEIRGLQRRHFERPGFIWLSADIAKGARERWVPVLPALQPVIAHALVTLENGDYLVCAQRSRGLNRVGTTPRHKLPASPQAILQLVARVGVRAGIAAHVHPHLLRHAFGDHVARHAGLRAAQALLGHASVETTESTYVGGVTLDELADAVRGSTFGLTGSPPAEHPAIPHEARTGIEPVPNSGPLGEPDSSIAEGDDDPPLAVDVERFFAPLLPTAYLYVAHFRGAAWSA